MRSVDDIADRYVTDWAALDPVSATHVGLSGQDGRMTDYSPEGFQARAELDRGTLAELGGVLPADDRERLALDSMVERLGVAVELADSGHPRSEVNVLASVLHTIRSVFDLMEPTDEESAAALVARLARVPDALAGWGQTLRAAADEGLTSAQDQILEVAKHCDRWSDPQGDDVFGVLARRVAPVASPALRRDLERAALGAAEAVARTGELLRTDLAPRGRAKAAVGRDLYALLSRSFLGTRVDLDETYQWGFEELARIERDMEATARRIVPGGGVAEAVAALDADPARTITGKEAFRRWMQDLADRAICDLHGTHFDIPDQIRTIECMIAPTSDGGIYYTAPSEDFSRAGRMWWSVPEGTTEFSTWREVTTVYHEGVPGHHLQVGQATAQADSLNRWQRHLCWTSGHGEGWALYAERLMDELGYFTDPGDRLGMLDAQAFRAARVIVDIGMHLELPIPRDNPAGFAPGQRWTPELGWRFMREHTRVPDALLHFELNRYLGWPGQAPAYKVGERLWLGIREDMRTRQGDAFDLTAFHRNALRLGSLGLDPFVAALSRWGAEGPLDGHGQQPMSS